MKAALVPDRPEYDLTFSPRAAKALRRGFVFAGSAHDMLTDTDVRVRTRAGSWC